MPSTPGSDATQSAWCRYFCMPRSPGSSAVAAPCMAAPEVPAEQKVQGRDKATVLRGERAAGSAPAESGHVNTDVAKPGDLPTTASRQDFYSLFLRILTSVTGK